MLKNMVRWMPLFLFVTYYVGITGFVHVHNVGGKAVVHSHPFSAKADHQHTGGMCQLIQQISHFNTVSSFFGIALIVFAGYFVLLFFGKLEEVYLSKYYHTLFCRPPPAAYTELH